jgi:hypothetical protein
MLDDRFVIGQRDRMLTGFGAELIDLACCCL